jgi:hypothetical protein
MVRTLHRPPAGGETPHEFDFLEGIDLGQVHRRPERTGTRRTWVYLALVLMAGIGIIVATVLLAGRETPVEPDAYHDSGVAQAIAAHDAEIAGTHDATIAQALAAHEAELASAYDSLITQAVTAHEAATPELYDSLIAQAVTAYEAEIVDAYDSLITQAANAHEAELSATHDALISMIVRER